VETSPFSADSLALNVLGFFDFIRLIGVLRDTPGATFFETYDARL